MSDSVFFEMRFWLLVCLSAVAPTAIYAALMHTRSITRGAVVALGLCLLVISGVDVSLLQSLEKLARLSRSLGDDALFASELSMALYVVPIFFGGVGVNLVSHVLIAHLTDAERRCDGERPGPKVAMPDPGPYPEVS
jgi:hypothetical protein